MKNKFFIGQKVRGFYGLNTTWGQGKDGLFIVTGVEQMESGCYVYTLKNVEKFSSVFGSGAGAPEHLLISEDDWQKLPLWYRLDAMRLRGYVQEKMKGMGY